MASQYSQKITKPSEPYFVLFNAKENSIALDPLAPEDNVRVYIPEGEEEEGKVLTIDSSSSTGLVFRKVTPEDVFGEEGLEEESYADHGSELFPLCFSEVEAEKPIVRTTESLEDIIESASSYLRKEENLGDLTSITTARSNLGLANAVTSVLVSEPLENDPLYEGITAVYRVAPDLNILHTRKLIAGSGISIEPYPAEAFHTNQGILISATGGATAIQDVSNVGDGEELGTVEGTTLVLQTLNFHPPLVTTSSGAGLNIFFAGDEEGHSFVQGNNIRFIPNSETGLTQIATQNRTHSVACLSLRFHQVIPRASWTDVGYSLVTEPGPEPEVLRWVVPDVGDADDLAFLYFEALNTNERNRLMSVEDQAGESFGQGNQAPYFAGPGEICIRRNSSTVYHGALDPYPSPPEGENRPSLYLFRCKVVVDLPTMLNSRGYKLKLRLDRRFKSESGGISTAAGKYTTHDMKEEFVYVPAYMAPSVTHTITLENTVMCDWSQGKDSWYFKYVFYYDVSPIIDAIELLGRRLNRTYDPYSYTPETRLEIIRLA